MQIPGTLNSAVSYVPQNAAEKQYYQSMFGKASVANAGRVTGKEAVIFLKQSNVDVSVLNKYGILQITMEKAIWTMLNLA